MIEIIGWVASATTLLSFCVKDIFKLRLIGTISCLIWIWYAIMKQDTPIILVNSAIIAIHMFYIFKMKNLFI